MQLTTRSIPNKCHCLSLLFSLPILLWLISDNSKTSMSESICKKFWNHLISLFVPINRIFNICCFLQTSYKFFFRINFCVTHSVDFSCAGLIKPIFVAPNAVHLFFLLLSQFLNNNRKKTNSFSIMNSSFKVRLLGFLVRHIVNLVLFSTDFHRFLN